MKAVAKCSCFFFLARIVHPKPLRLDRNNSLLNDDPNTDFSFLQVDSNRE